MHEVRVESLEEVENAGGEVRLLANAGDLSLVFPRDLWEKATRSAAPPLEPTPGELSELGELGVLLKEYAEGRGFATVLTDVPCGDIEGGQRFDLVLRPAGMFAVTTGYVFLPTVSTEHVARYGMAMEEENFVEQGYLVGAVSGMDALAAGDEALKIVSVRGRRCSSSRFELAPELWRVLSEGLGWKNVEPVAPAAESRG